MEENILDKFFYIREEEISENIKEDTENLKSKLKKVKQEDINNIIEKLPEEYFEIKRELKDKVEELIIIKNIINVLLMMQLIYLKYVNKI